MTLNPFRHTSITSDHCTASVGAGVTCGRESPNGDGLCTFHRTLFGPWLKAATKRAA